MEPVKVCCFTGHRPEKLPWRGDEWDPRCVALQGRIMVELRQAYRRGYRHFITGMARGVDTYCCEAVLKLRQERGDVRLEAAIPCREQADKWPEKDRERYRRLLAQCDLRTLIQESYTPGCMLRRDRYMVTRSEGVLGVYDMYTSGGTKQTLAYALEQKREIVLIDLGDFMR